MYEALKQIAIAKIGKDIVIIGKGPSLDELNLELLNDCIVINTNDSEIIYPGDIAVFHHGWVLDLFDEIAPKCKLYVSDKELPPDISSIKANYIPYTPESADFLLHRFFSEKIYIEHAILVSALQVADKLAKQSGERKNVYLVGFDFTTKNGFSKKLTNSNDYSTDEALMERLISSQEKLLHMILGEKQRLSINIYHVGEKSYSMYSSNAFSKIFSLRKKGVQKNYKEDNFKEKEFQVKIVAEITTNHFGDMDRLQTMILSAKHAGADYIKLQKRDVETFYSSEKLDSEYNSPFGKTFREYRLGIELTKEHFKFINKFCKEIGIGWFASILDLPSYNFIQEFNPEMIKLPSTISEHTEYLSAVANDFTKDVVISTGYTDTAYETFILNSFKKARNIYLLQCTSAYPTPMVDTQIGVVRHYYNLSKKNQRIIPGFSSHDIGSMCSMMAVAAGACMIEKHVKFGDVAWSHFDEVAIDLSNGDFEKFVKDIRLAEKIVGDEEKVVKGSEHHKYWLVKN